ncbi:MAG: FmdB family zinc ribbon protein, partial [Candidatus Ratteibacteria bacterium]
MPTYDYECKKCGHSYRKFQKMTDEPDKICPECKGEVRRLIGLGGGVIYKGSGFYTT